MIKHEYKLYYSLFGERENKIILKNILQIIKDLEVAMKNILQKLCRYKKRLYLCKRIHGIGLSRGVMVTHVILVHIFQVRVLAG